MTKRKKADLITRDEAIEFFKDFGIEIPKSTLEYWQFAGILEGSQIGKKVYYTTYQLEQFILKRLDRRTRKVLDKKR